LTRIYLGLGIITNILLPGQILKHGAATAWRHCNKMDKRKQIKRQNNADKRQDNADSPAN